MWITLLVGIALAVSRIFLGVYVEPESATWIGVYKDFAHLFMGGLAVSWFHAKADWKWSLFWGLNVVEVVTAVLSRMC